MACAAVHATVPVREVSGPRVAAMTANADVGRIPFSSLGRRSAPRFFFGVTTQVDRVLVARCPARHHMLQRDVLTLPQRMVRVYVGNLRSDTDKSEIEREFEKFGKLNDVWVARNPPGFAFLEYDDARDADVCLLCCDAVCKTHAIAGRSQGARRKGGLRHTSAR